MARSVREDWNAQNKPSASDHALGANGTISFRGEGVLEQIYRRAAIRRAPVSSQAAAAAGRRSGRLPQSRLLPLWRLNLPAIAEALPGLVGWPGTGCTSTTRTGSWVWWRGLRA